MHVTVFYISLFVSGMLYVAAGLLMILIVDQYFYGAIDRLVKHSWFLTFVVWFLWPLSLPVCLLLHWRYRRRAESLSDLV